MKILNVMKRAGICFGLLLITTIINSNYQYSIAQDDTKSTKSQKSRNKKSQKHKNTNISEEEINTVKIAFNAFQKLIENGVDTTKFTEFYKQYCPDNIYQGFFITKANKPKFDKLLIQYVVNLLSSAMVKKIKGYKLSDKFTKITKKKYSIIKCKLINAQDDKDIIDMSVNINKNQKVTDISLMQEFKLFKGAKNKVHNYCEDNKIKHKQYRKFKDDKKLEICEKAWAQ